MDCPRRHTTLALIARRVSTQQLGRRTSPLFPPQHLRPNRTKTNSSSITITRPSSALVHLLHRGKLLAPNLKLRDYTGSCPSLSSSTVRSPSSKGSQVEDGAYGYRRPVIETRSWSYDNVPTYQPMKMPPSIEKRKVKQMVDGVEKEVTIEVEVENNGKRLFNFPDKQYYTRR
ncbi:hypothetical protein PTI98_009234 [Pleurotus ostreatus]|nr:hypothetical protein PTI98_009234 [Pleurotus ostreatus]